MNTSIKKESVCSKFLCAWDVLPSKVFFLLLVVLLCMVTACSDDDSKTAGGSTEDQNTIAIEDMTIVGVSQKGPFIRGAKVLAYELQDGETLKQTGKNFVGSITRDDGLFDVRSVSLMSQYVYMSVNGFYLNEVTGEQSDAPVLLQAITDLTLRDETNINLLTHLEYERVLALVDREKMTIKDAKAQAESEVMKAFYIDLSLENNFEDLNIFSAGDDNAALLAISIMMQGDLKEAAFSERLTYFAQDLEVEGEWNNEKVKAAIADWVSTADYKQIRRNVESWELGDEVPPFEKYLNNFWWQNYALGNCDESREDEVAADSNEYSVNYYGNSQIRYICRSGAWKVVTEMDYDTYGEKCTSAEVGKIINGKVTESNKYYCLANGWVSLMDWNWDVPKDVRFNSGIDYGSMTDARDGKTYKTVKIGNQVWMAENLNYDYNKGTANSFCYDNKEEYCAVTGRLYTWAAAIDSVALANDAENPRTCGVGKSCLLENVQCVCPSGWHLPSYEEWETLLLAVGENNSGIVLKSQTGWHDYDKHSVNGTDAYGFSVLPAGVRDCGVGFYDADDIDYGVGFHDAGDWAYFWSSGGPDGSHAYTMFLNPKRKEARLSIEYIRHAFSVRCVQN